MTAKFMTSASMRAVALEPGSISFQKAMVQLNPGESRDKAGRWRDTTDSPHACGICMPHSCRWFYSAALRPNHLRELPPDANYIGQKPVTSGFI